MSLTPYLALRYVDEYRLIVHGQRRSWAVAKTITGAPRGVGDTRGDAVEDYLRQVREAQEAADACEFD